jgi:hypothetical protein
MHVLPLATQQPVFTGSFTILGFGSDTPDEALPDLVSADHFSTGCLVEDEREVYLHRRAFRRLASAALDPAKSRALIHVLSNITPVHGPSAWDGPEGMQP